jgi:hypothetical protein
MAHCVFIEGLGALLEEGQKDSCPLYAVPVLCVRINKNSQSVQAGRKIKRI